MLILNDYSCMVVLFHCDMLRVMLLLPSLLLAIFMESYINFTFRELVVVRKILCHLDAAIFCRNGNLNTHSEFPCSEGLLYLLQWMG